MKTLLTLLAALSLAGCPGEKATPPTPTPPEKTPAPAPAPRSAHKVAGCYQWQAKGEGAHQIRIVPSADGFEGKYLGWEGSDYVAWFRVDLHDLKVEGDTVLFTFGTRDLYGEPVGLDEDLSTRKSDGFNRTGWAYEGKLGEKGITFTCTAEGEQEHCWTDAGLFARVPPELCGPAPEAP